MFWPRGKIEVFVFSSPPSGLKFLVLLIFNLLPPHLLRPKGFGFKKGGFLEVMEVVP